jgi:hypothetical protein
MFLFFDYYFFEIFFFYLVVASFASYWLGKIGLIEGQDPEWVLDITFWWRIGMYIIFGAGVESSMMLKCFSFFFLLLLSYVVIK